MIYAAIKIEHDYGITYLGTCASSLEKCISNAMEFEGCPQSAIKVKEVPKELFSLGAKYLFKTIKA